MSEMIERVASALWAVSAKSWAWEECPPAQQAGYRQHARAAIEAMRVPTVEMVVDATEDWMCVRAFEDRAEAIWDAMINRALGIYPPVPGVSEQS